MLKPRLVQFYTSSRLRNWRRQWFAWLRRLERRPRRVHYFHQCDDPYSQLLLQCLPQLLRRHCVELWVHLVPAADAAAVPERERLDAWARRDAAELARVLDLRFTDAASAPSADHVASANAAVCALGVDRVWDAAELERATLIGDALWRGDPAQLAELAQADATEVEQSIKHGANLRRRLGHYASAMLYSEGEWYWGVDRIDHLQRRLAAEQSDRDRVAYPIANLPALTMSRQPLRSGVALHFYCSLRSPYSYLAIDRVMALAAHYQADLQIRFVLPMVMRGLPVPRAKRLYIVHDAKRVAEQLGLDFGRIADPLGAPTERGLAVLNQAIAIGKGAQFLRAYGNAVWSQGIDAGSDGGLSKIAQQAGLNWDFVQQALNDERWRDVALANREELLQHGLWGVPCFRVDGYPAYWGQDRLWLLERDLQSAAL